MIDTPELDPVSAMLLDLVATDPEHTARLVREVTARLLHARAVLRDVIADNDPPCDHTDTCACSTARAIRLLGHDPRPNVTIAEAHT